MLSKAQMERFRWFTVWNDVYSEDGCYREEDVALDLTERTWLWAHRNPERAKVKPKQKGEQKED